MIGEWDTFHQMASKSELKPTLHSKTFDTDKLTLVLMGDMHIGSKFYDADRHKEILEWCWEQKTPLILMGDNIEAATRDSVGAGVYEQSEIIEEQVEHFYHLFKPFAKEGLILGMHEGNHEARVYKATGFDLAKNMARQLGISYFSYSKLHNLIVGNQSYTMYTTHGASGATKPHTKIKGALDLSHVADTEIYAMGHVHTLDHHVRTYYEVDKRNKKIVQKKKHFIITGSYLSHWGSYGHIKNMEPSPIGSPKLKLSGVEHEVRVSL